MSGFKLIAIHILDDCYADVRKILPIGGLYQFYSFFDFKLREKNEVHSIHYNKENDIRIYDIKRANNQDLIINVSAIVGQNGSGKSSILELFYAFCLCISKDQEEIKSELDRLKAIGSSKWTFINYLFNFLRVEVFYEEDGFIKSIQYNGNNGSKTFYFNPNRNNNDVFNLKEFCYTIAINYSIYGLNEINSPWLSPMFHKNDGYQSPLVINPYRTDGNIDVNKEYHLANSRLMHNLSLYGEGDPIIINGQRLWKVKFSFAPKNLDSLYYSDSRFDLNKTINNYEEISQKSIYDFFNKLSKSLVDEILYPGQIAIFNQMKKNGTEECISNYRMDKRPSNRSAYIEYWFVRYIIKKIFKICLQYAWFRKKYIDLNKNGNFISIRGEFEDELIQNLLADKSHITLKLRQTFVMWKRRYFFDKVNWGELTNQNNLKIFACFCEIDGIQLNDAIGLINTNKSTTERFDLERIPGGILRPEILVARDSFPGSSSKMEALSSGEQQLLFIIQTIIYHLNNLESVFETDPTHSNIIKTYSNVMIILDEVELYFHPEFQRILVRELLLQIEQINLINIKRINILFSTHSQFILSDIPATNILKIKNGVAQNYNQNERTFGANVHDLLANDFFMENGFMGECAKEKIQSAIKFLEYAVQKERLPNLENPTEWSKETVHNFIDIIGEPLIRNNLKEMYYQAFLDNNNEELDKEIALLTKRRDSK